MKIWKKALRFALCVIPFAAVGGWFTGSYAYASYSAEVQREILAQVGSIPMLCLSSAFSSIMLALFCGFVGYLLSHAVGLMGPLGPEREKLLPALGATLGCGACFALADWVFSRRLPQVAALYESGLLTRRLDNWLSSVFYGGVVEEVLLRLFFMSLLAFLIWKVFFRKFDREHIPAGVFVAANILSAGVFAAGHLPATVSMFGALTPLVVARCFLLNGGLGLAFGWLYRKYGIQYAMLGHAGAHVISKLVWLVLI